MDMPRTDPAGWVCGRRSGLASGPRRAPLRTSDSALVRNPCRRDGTTTVLSRSCGWDHIGDQTDVRSSNTVRRNRVRTVGAAGGSHRIPARCDSRPVVFRVSAVYAGGIGAFLRLPVSGQISGDDRESCVDVDSLSCDVRDMETSGIDLCRSDRYRHCGHGPLAS